jgi:hypothetical protein
MIRQLETRNFRMLRANRVSMMPFQVLVGPNAAGKTTFLDALQFITDVLNLGASEAVARRTPDFYDLCYDTSLPLSLAVEVDAGGGPAPEAGSPAILRYEIEIGIMEPGALRILRENLFFLTRPNGSPWIQPSLFGDESSGPVVHASSPAAWRRIAGKSAAGGDYYQDEKTRWNAMFRFGDDRSAFGNLPEDPGRFSLSLRAKNLLKDGIRRLALEPRRLQASSPPGGKPFLGLDGSCLPNVVKDLAERDPVLFDQWKKHVATAVPGLRDILVEVREEDRHLVLSARFDGEHPDPVPSWLLSDGTLRLMALTVLSYAARTDRRVVYLVEEPENGLNPLAIQAAYQAIASPGFGIQWLCATHSPVFLAHAILEDALVFRRQDNGSSMVRRGPEVPELSRWTGSANLSDLLVMGILS